MPIGEAHTFFGQPIDVRRGDLAAPGVVAAHISIAEVVSVDDDDVRLTGGPCIEGRSEPGHKEETRENVQTGRAR